MNHLKPADPFVISEIEKQEKQKLEEKAERSPKPVFKKETSNRKFVGPPSKFYPEDYSVSDWESLGLSQKQAEVVVNYCKKGVYSLEYFSKIYVLPDGFIEHIKDSMVFKSKVAQKAKSEIEDIQIVSEGQELTNINTANFDRLIKVNGVGKFYAKKIIELRQSLGGIVNMNQLLDLPYMDDEKLDILIKQFEIEPWDIKKMNINTSTIEELKAHPYVNYNVANSIVKMREQRNGEYKAIDEIKESLLIDDELFEKIKPYLSL